MRIEINQSLVNRNKRIATILFFASLVVLGGGLLIISSTAPSKDGTVNALSSVLSLLVIPASFILTIFSVRMTNLWLRQPRPEDAIQAGLKGAVVAKRTALYHYYHFPARHVLIAPQGVFAIVTRFQDGKYTVTGDKWKVHGGPFAAIMRFLRRDDIGNPTADALKAAARVQQLLEGRGVVVPVQPLVLFVDPRAQIEIVSSDVPILFTSDQKEPNLHGFLRDLAAQMPKPSAADKKDKKKKLDSTVEDPESTIGIDSEAIADAFDDATAAMIAG